MPLPFDMLAVMLYLGWYAETRPGHTPDISTAILICLAAIPVMTLAAAAANYAATRALRRPGRTRASRRSIAGNAELAVRLTQVALFAAVLHWSALPWTLADALGITAKPGAVSLNFAVQFFGLLPYVALFFAGWLPLFTLHKTISYGTWTRKSFIQNKARYNLYMLAAWAPFAFVADLLSEHLYVLPLLFAAAAWFFPAVLAKLWGCKPLSAQNSTGNNDAVTLALVRELEEKTGAAFSKVYLWEPGGGMMNAAAVGLLKPFRYLFLTPALLRGLSQEELSAVILHELGHVRHRHLLFYLFTTMAGVNVSVIAAAFLPLEGSTERFVASVACILFYFRFVFGWLSRNMERQADLYAMEQTGSSRPLANALEKLGLAAGHIRLAASWHHLGIAERVDFLRRAERWPALTAAHNAGVRMLKAGGYCAAMLTMAFIARELRTEYFPARPAAGIERTDRLEEAHWRRVDALLRAPAPGRK